MYVICFGWLKEKNLRDRLLKEKVYWGKTPKKKEIVNCVQGSLYYQAKQGTIIGEIPQNYPTFALFDPPKIGNLMTPG